MKCKHAILITGLMTTMIAAGCKHDPMPGPGNGNTNDPADTTTVPTDPANPKFKTDILPIFTANCNGCHNSVTPNDGYNFTTYESTIAKKFEPGDPDETKLYEAITEDDEEDRMPQTPNPRLSAEKIQLIKKWIENGAPNN